MIFLVGTLNVVSAATWDDKKIFEKDYGKYGKINIHDSIFLGFGVGDKRAEYTLTENTDQCLINCHAEGTATLYESEKLFSDLKFKGRDNQNKNIKSSKILIEVEEEYQEEVYDYTEICIDNVNGTKSCSQEITGSHMEARTKIYWQEYNGKQLTSGNYTWRIEGTKKIGESVDWIGSAFGKDFTEWAWWNGDWNRRKQVNITSSTIDLVNYTILINVTSESEMQSDYDDVQFIDGECSGVQDIQLDLDKINYTSNSALFYVRVPTLNATIDEICMYYGNALASDTSTSDAYAFDNVWHFQDNMLDSKGLNNCTLATGTEQYGNSPEGRGFDFNGITGIGCGDPVVSGDEITALARYKMDTQAAINRIFDKFDYNMGGGTAFPNNGFRTSVATSNPRVSVDSNLAIGTTNFETVTLLYNATDVVIYQRGIERNKGAQTGNVLDGAGGFAIGTAQAGSQYWDGIITELWRVNKALSPEYIERWGNNTNFNLITFGTEEMVNEVITELISPEDNVNFTINSITFSVNSTPSVVNLTNVTLYIWNNTGELYQTNFTSLSSNVSVITNWTMDIQDGDYIWNALTKGTNDAEGWAINRTFIVDTTPPIINLLSPTGIIDYHLVGDNLTLNWSVTEINLDSCWFNYNSINTSVTCGDNNYSFITTTQKNLTFYANDTFGSVGNNFTSWDYKILEVNQTFNNQSFEASQEIFGAEIILGDGFSLSEAIFNYNFTNYTTNIIFTSGTYFITSTIVLPTVELATNISFNFYVVVGGDTFPLQLHQQEVLNINMSECGVGDNLLMNMTLYDEETKLILLGDIEINAQAISKTSNEITSSVNLNLKNISSGAICLFPAVAFQGLYLDAEIKYSSSDYTPELYYIQKADMEDYPINLSLFDLPINFSTDFLIKYQDDDLISVEGAVIQLQRKYISEDLYEIVEAPLTSDIGTAIVHINLNTNKYKATVVKDGIVLDIFDNLVFNCENELSGQCTENLFGQIDSQNDIPLTQLDDFAYLILPVNNTITVIFSIPSGTPASINILLTQVDQFGNKTQCNQTIISSAGSIDCTWDDTIGDSYLELKILKNAVLKAQQSYIILEDSGLDFLGNNFFIIIILMLSVVGMGFSSPEWMIINGVVVMLIGGAFWLLNGVDFVMGLGSLIWLIIAAGILIYKLSKQEDR